MGETDGVETLHRAYVIIIEHFPIGILNVLYFFLDLLNLLQWMHGFFIIFFLGHPSRSPGSEIKPCHPLQFPSKSLPNSHYASDTLSIAHAVYNFKSTIHVAIYNRVQKHFSPIIITTPVEDPMKITT